MEIQFIVVHLLRFAHRIVQIRSSHSFTCIIIITIVCEARDDILVLSVLHSHAKRNLFIRTPHIHLFRTIHTTLGACRSTYIRYPGIPKLFKLLHEHQQRIKFPFSIRQIYEVRIVLFLPEAPILLLPSHKHMTYVQHTPHMSEFILVSKDSFTFCGEGKSLMAVRVVSVCDLFLFFVNSF